MRSIKASWSASFMVCVVVFLWSYIYTHRPCSTTQLLIKTQAKDNSGNIWSLIYLCATVQVDAVPWSSPLRTTLYRCSVEKMRTLSVPAADVRTFLLHLTRRHFSSPSLISPHPITSLWRIVSLFFHSESLSVLKSSDLATVYYCWCSLSLNNMELF